MGFWKKIYNKIKKPVEWIEIKVPEKIFHKKEHEEEEDDESESSDEEKTKEEE